MAHRVSTFIFHALYTHPVCESRWERGPQPCSPRARGVSSTPCCRRRDWSAIGGAASLACGPSQPEKPGYDLPGPLHSLWCLIRSHGDVILQRLGVHRLTVRGRPLIVPPRGTLYLLCKPAKQPPGIFKSHAGNGCMHDETNNIGQVRHVQAGFVKASCEVWSGLQRGQRAVPNHRTF